MLRVRTYIDRSAVHGIGVFAAEDIPEGALVWEYHPSVDVTYTSEQWAAMHGVCSDASLEQIGKYAYKEEGCHIVCVDNAQFMNHSPAPNVHNDKTANLMRAMRHISRGEELLCDYFQYSDPDDPHLGFIKQ